MVTRISGFAWAQVSGALLVLLTALALSGCAGYRVGSIGGKEIQGIQSVYIPMAKNDSYTPDVITYVTNQTIRAFDNDGTLKTEQNSRADSQLTIVVKEVRRNALRPTRDDVLVTAEYGLTIRAEITLTNRELGKNIINRESITGYTTFFVQNDLNEAQRQALPLAAEDLGRNICLRVVEGW